MSRRLLAALAVASVAVLAPSPAEASKGKDHKVTICHYPPGNPDNAHTIEVDESAVATHLARHGDSLGACGTQEEPPPTQECWTGDGYLTWPADQPCPEVEEPEEEPQEEPTTTTTTTTTTVPPTTTTIPAPTTSPTTATTQPTPTDPTTPTTEPVAPVTPSPAPAPAAPVVLRELPRTGSHTGALVALGLGAVALGLFLTSLARKEVTDGR